MAKTFAQDMADKGIQLTASDVLLPDELADYVAHGGKGSDVANRVTDEERPE